MTQKYFIYILFFFSSILIGYSQRINDFKPLEARGKIPNDFIQLSSEKYLIDKQNIDANESYSRRMLRKKFLLLSNFYIEYILNSGYIIFNDSISNYVNGVADHLLKNQPELRKELRFYTIKSPEVNAFATDKGIIFVSVGLLSQIQTESQLAWVLSHEIIHYKNKHNIESYIENEEILKGEGEYSKSSKSMKLSAMFKYSHENESEADTKGLEEIYSKTDYSVEDVRNIFDVLLYSYLPIEEIDFDKTFFETELFKFPDSYSPKEVKQITAIEGYDDSESTHPNIKKRRESINNILNKIQKQNGKSFSAYSKETFLQIRQISRYELCNIYLTNHKFEDAIYTAYAIMKKDSFSNEYLESVIAKGLYGLSKFKNNGYYSKAHVNIKKVEGSKYNLVYLFNEISKKELNILAITYLWNHKENYPDNIDLGPMSDDMLKELVFVNKLLPDSFYLRNEILSKSDEIPDTLSEEQISKLDKYEKIKYKRKKQISSSTGSSNYNYALSDLIKKQDFAQKFENYKNEYLKQKNDESSIIITSYSNEPNTKSDRRYGKKLGVDKIVFVNPLVFISNRDNGKNELDFLASEKQETIILEKIKNLSTKVGLTSVLIDNKLFSENDITLFNDASILTNWLYEYSTINDSTYYNPLSYKIKEIAIKYNTDYFAWLSYDSYPTKNYADFGRFVKYAITAFGFPIGVSELTKSNYYNSFNIVIYDVSKNKLILNKTTTSHERLNNNDLVNSVLYDFLFEIKSKPRKK